MLKLKSKFKFILCLFLLFSICFSKSLSNVVQAKTVPISVSEKFLVLVQNKDKSFTAYEDLVVKTAGNLMVKAYSTSKAVGLKYTKTTSTKFNVANGSKVLYFTKGTKTYTYYNGKTKTNYSAVFAPYTTKKTKTDSASNVVHYACLSKLVNTKYFAGSKATQYKANGYEDIIVYSKYGKITDLPDINKVVDSNGNSIVTDTPSTPTPSPTPTPSGGTINIGGIEVPKLDSFVPANSDTDGWFGTDTKDSHPYYDATKKFDKYIVQAMTDIGENLLDEVNTVKYIDDTISISPYGGHWQHQAMKLYKNTDKNQYELTLKVRLYDSEYSTIYRNSLKLLLASFTNEVDTLYKAIYSDWETDDNTYGINKESFVTIGSCKVKYVSGGTYIIKAK